MPEFSAKLLRHPEGYFHLDEPKDAQGRFRKTQPPKTIGRYSTQKEADFLQFGHTPGPLCIECKNHREWLYPHSSLIRELIVKACELGALPVMIARRIHYTTRTNFFEPAGIIAHEALHQYFPSDQADLADRVKHRRSLGFTDVLATEDPEPRTRQFFTTFLPSVVAPMAKNWNANRDALHRYATEEINLAELYTAIGSPAGGKWVRIEDQEPPPEHEQ